MTRRLKLGLANDKIRYENIERGTGYENENEASKIHIHDFY